MMRRLFAGFVAAVALCLSGVGPAASEEDAWYFETEVGFETGDFGTDVRSDLYGFTPTLGYVTPRFDLSLSVPVLALDDGTDGTVTGIGDVFLEGGMVLWSDPDDDLSLIGSLGVKLPTADADRGLGTGETDIAATLTLRRFFGRLGLWGSAGYLYTGDPASGSLNNLFLYDIGASAFFRKGSLYASFEGRSPVVSGAPAPKEIHLGGYRALFSDYAVRVDGFAGLNDGGSDFGGSLALIRWF